MKANLPPSLYLSISSHSVRTENSLAQCRVTPVREVKASVPAGPQHRGLMAVALTYSGVTTSLILQPFTQPLTAAAIYNYHSAIPSSIIYPPIHACIFPLIHQPIHPSVHLPILHSPGPPSTFPSIVNSVGCYVRL